jgi:thiol-disulfide isomerase/thioredoxin
MRALIGSVAALILFLVGCSGLNESVKSDDLVGPIVRSQLPDSFLAAYDTVRIESMFIDLIGKAGGKVETKVFLGTWCSDSRRELPRFLKVIDLAGSSFGPVRLYGLDRNKKSPGGEEIPFHVELVPTFVFLRDGKEIGRIVERPRTSMEADILTILASGLSQ